MQVMNKLYCLLLLCLPVLAWSCSSETTSETETRPAEDIPLFTLLEPGQTGVNFVNTLTEDKEVNFYMCLNCYNGAGVAAGDINNDGLPDLYFTSNQEQDKLYLNKGNMQFEDITEQAGILDAGGWRTGVTMADVNADGLLDIYVCRSLKFFEPEDRANLLYINNGDGTFSERAEEFGLNDMGYSTHATFFDYDLDGDLDVYVMSRPSAEEPLTESRAERERRSRDPYVRDQMYRNNGDNTFSLVSAEAGIYNYAYGLSVTAGDLNNDGWPDLYVANDFNEQDFIYMNNGDGTFTDRVTEMTRHISNFSMGADIADFNNDGHLDVYVLDMVAEDHYRNKVLMGAMDSEKFYRLLDSGYHRQYMANTLQINNGNGTFSEIGQLAGVSKTDWSWSALFADLDNDGYKDIFVSNGILRDLRHNDYIRMLADVFTRSQGQMTDRNFNLLLETPSTRINNYVFRNNRDLTFTKKISEWGMDNPGFSNGAAYADLDGDGDLDIVTNNVNDPASIYRNNASNSLANNYVRFRLKGSSANPGGLGSRIRIDYGENQFQVFEMTLSRGFMSASEGIAHFGLGAHKTLGRVEITWPDGRHQTMENVKANQLIELRHSDARAAGPQDTGAQAALFNEIDPRSRGINFVHREMDFDDFEKEILLPHRMSQNGPGIAVGDVNGDGRDDFYVGGARGMAGELYLQLDEGRFSLFGGQPWERHSQYEDLGVLLFDADSDGDMDLYVVSGSNEKGKTAAELQDRLYLNNGKGQFSFAKKALPVMQVSGSCVVAGDYDRDGDLDLFVGGRVIPGEYPFPARSYLLRNDGGTFSDITGEAAPGLKNPGLVTAAQWTDFDRDGALDLIVVGEWMPVSLFRNNAGTFENVTAAYGLSQSVGWWNSVSSGDFDNDGDTDYILGNLGKNAKYKASPEKPLHVYCDDFDGNGIYDIVLAYHQEDKCFPVRGRECSSEQMPFIANKFSTYHEFASATLEDVYGEEALAQALHYEAQHLYTSYLENKGGKMELKRLPIRAQFAPVFGVLNGDFNADGNLDALLVGNFYAQEVETIRYDAFTGLLLTGDGAGNFEPVLPAESGFFVPGDAKGAALLSDAGSGKQLVLVASNASELQLFEAVAKASATRILDLAAGDTHAELILHDGRTRRQEFPFGSGYLSGSSRSLSLDKSIKEATIYSSDGTQRLTSFDQLAER